LGATFKGSIETTYKSVVDWVGAAASQFLELTSVSDGMHPSFSWR